MHCWHTSTLISAEREGDKPVALTRLERERLTDSQMKIQSVAKSMKHVDPKKVTGFAEIEECLEDADKSLKEALRGSKSDNG